VIEQAIVFMVAVSLPLMLVVEQITCWRSGRARSDELGGHEDHGVVPSLPPRSRAGSRSGAHPSLEGASAGYPHRQESL